MAKSVSDLSETSVALFTEYCQNFDHRAIQAIPSNPVGRIKRMIRVTVITMSAPLAFLPRIKSNRGNLSLERTMKIQVTPYHPMYTRDEFVAHH